MFEFLSQTDFKSITHLVPIMTHNDAYLPVIFAALAVLILGCLNLDFFRAKDSAGKPSEYPSYLWLSLAALLVGVFVCVLQQSK